jgi:hypothetical protein
VSVKALEDDILVALYGDEPANPIALSSRMSPLEAQMDELLLALLARNSARPHYVTLAVFGDREYLWELARWYHAIALRTGCTLRLNWFSRHGQDQLRRHPCAELEVFLADPDAKAIGVAMGLDGRFASLRFSPELGIHQFRQIGEEGHEKLCMVDTSDISLADYEPPARVEFPEDPTGDARRVYNMEACTAEDSVLKQKLSWTGRSIERVLAEAIDLQLRNAMWGVLEQ